MIYFDNAAGTLPKPEIVIQAMDEALQSIGNPGRSSHDFAMDAARAVLKAREAVSALVGLEDPLRVAFTSSFTEAMSLAIAAFIKPGDRVAVDEQAHNSVLRPLYLRGALVDALPCDALGRAAPDAIDQIKPGTRAVFLTHGSNVTGNLSDAREVYEHVRKRGVLLFLDAAQTLGEADVTTDMADVICFTGHKALFGPQGTGGLILRHGLEARVVKTGGTGTHTYEPLQSAGMPDAFEAGTPNAQGLCALTAGIRFIAQTGLKQVSRHNQSLIARLYQGLREIPGLTVYGDFDQAPRLPVLSFLIDGMDSAEVTLALWEGFSIASRAGGHCAPLLHKRLGTDRTGLTRLSLSLKNTEEEVDACIRAVSRIARDGG